MLEESFQNGDRVRLHYPEHQRQGPMNKHFHGKTGTIVGTEKDGKKNMHRVALDSPAHIQGVGDVHDDLWAPSYLKRHSLKETTMNEDFEPIADVITLVANDQHAEATGLVNDLLGARVMDSLQNRKETIAQSLFAPSADSLQEAIVQEEHESVEDFVKRGGKITQVAPGKAHGSQKPQTIKKAKQYFVKKG